MSTSGVRTSIVVSAYLCAAVLANLLVLHVGPWALPATALLLIPFDLFSRDVLHERWRGTHLRLRMACLVLAGSLVSWASVPDSRSIAFASACSFLLAGVTDALVFERLRYKPRWVKMNLSNVASALVDSVAFPLLAFSMIDPMLSLSQAGLKILGGAAWIVVCTRRRN